MWVAPQARLDDGLFDVMMLGDVSLLYFMRHSGKLYRGNHLALPEVRLVRGRRVVVTPLRGTELTLDVDGESPGKMPATYEILPGALRVRCKA
jgi:diacylglycerol kinase (ATP)